MLKILFLYPLSLLFSLVVGLRNWLYDKRILSIKKSNIPIISVGNLDVGGTGKTPFVIELCNILEQQNLRPLIITRGYKRQTKELIFINTNDDLEHTAQNLGDEPYHIIKSIKDASMIIDHNKKRAIDFANTLNNIDYIILDDGYQSRYIQKNIEIVLLNMSRPSNWYNMLPLGGLREPIKNLKRADFIYTIKGENNSRIKSKKLNTSFKIIEYKNGVKSNQVKIDTNQKLISCCGIGDPKFFDNTLKELNVRINKKIHFINHIKYNKDRLEQLETLLKNNDGLITTYKDFVKFNQQFLNKYLIYVVKMKIKIDDKKLIEKICL